MSDLESENSDAFGVPGGDGDYVSINGAQCGEQVKMTDDAAFIEKLKNMGEKSFKKFSVLANLFGRRKEANLRDNLYN
jgi:hypothetical protein